jgi:hypothetical protein
VGSALAQAEASGKLRDPDPVTRLGQEIEELNHPVHDPDAARRGHGAERPPTRRGGRRCRRSAFWATGHDRATAVSVRRTHTRTISRRYSALP